ncbi:MAG: Yip1 family protein [Bacillota bacterium]
MEIQPQTGTGNPGFFTRFGRLFVSPSTLFADLAAKPDFLWPLVFLLVIAGFTYPISRYTAKVMADLYPKAAEMMAAQGQGIILLAGIIGGLFGLVVAWLVRTGVFILFAKVLGGEAPSFKVAFSAIGYTHLPQALRVVFQGGTVLLAGTLPPLGLEMGMELGERFTSPLGVLLGEINPFTLGYLVLTSIALEKAFKLSRGKAVFTTVLTWAIALAYHVVTVVYYARMYK